MREEIRRLVTVSSGVAELTLNKAEGLARDLVERAGLSPDQVTSLGHEIVERSRENRRELLALVRSEIRAQLTGLGVANRHEIERLERRVARLEERLRPSYPADVPAAAPPKRPRKTTARKKTATRRRAGAGTKTAARKRSTARAKKTTARAKPTARG